mmetsp:Transcript_19488/g.30934  ORF Transcript_19488/g.30934 Transcript_19488/m.30934 type:complete len:208 (-) Transcript_19488:473-1096(-)
MPLRIGSYQQRTNVPTLLNQSPKQHASYPPSLIQTENGNEVKLIGKNPNASSTTMTMMMMTMSRRQNRKQELKRKPNPSHTIIKANGVKLPTTTKTIKKVANTNKKNRKRHRRRIICYHFSVSPQKIRLQRRKQMQQVMKATMFTFQPTARKKPHIPKTQIWCTLPTTLATRRTNMPTKGIVTMTTTKLSTLTTVMAMMTKCKSLKS